MRRVVIYSLSCPISGKVRYVGQTIMPIKDRLISHVSERNNNAKCLWIKELIDNNLIPIIEEIDIVDIYEANNVEMYWINQFNEWGYELLNVRGLNKKQIKTNIYEKTTVDKLIKLPIPLYNKILYSAKKDGRTFHGYVLNLLNKVHK